MADRSTLRIVLDALADYDGVESIARRSWPMFQLPVVEVRCVDANVARGAHIVLARTKQPVARVFGGDPAVLQITPQVDACPIRITDEMTGKDVAYCLHGSEVDPLRRQLARHFDTDYTRYGGYDREVSS